MLPHVAYLVVLVLLFPRVNTLVLRVTATVGFLCCLTSLFMNYAFEPALTWYRGVLYLPLLAISLRPGTVPVPARGGIP